MLLRRFARLGRSLIVLCFAATSAMPAVAASATSTPVVATTSSFSITFPGEPAIALSALTYALSIPTIGTLSSTAAGAVSPSGSATFTVTNATPSKLLVQTLTGKSLKQVVVSTPSATIRFTKVLLTSATSTSNGSSYSMAFAGSTITPGSSPATSATGLPVPNIAIGGSAFALASEALSSVYAGSPVVQKAGAELGKVTYPPAALTFASPDALALFAMIGKPYSGSTLAASAGTYRLQLAELNAVSATFDGSGTPHVAAQLTYSGVTTQLANVPAAPLGQLSGTTGDGANFPISSLSLDATTTGSKVVGTATMVVSDPPSALAVQTYLETKKNANLAIHTTGGTFDLGGLIVGSASMQNGALTIALTPTKIEIENPATSQTASASTTTPNITIGETTYPLRNETVSSTGPVVRVGAVGAGAPGNAISSARIVFDDPVPLSLLVNALQGSQLGNATLRTTAGNYLFGTAVFSAFALDLRATLPPKVVATVSFAKESFEPAAGSAVASGAFYAVLVPTTGSPTTVPLSGMVLGTSINIDRPSKSAVQLGRPASTATIDALTASANVLLDAVNAQTVFAHIDVHTPSGVVTFERAAIGAGKSKQAQVNAASSTYALTFASISMPTLATHTSAAVPRMQLGSNAYAITSDTIGNFSAPTKSTSLSYVSSALFTDASAFALFGDALTAPAMTPAQVISSASTLDLLSAYVTSVQSVFDASGTPSTTASFSFVDSRVTQP